MRREKGLAVSKVGKKRCGESKQGNFRLRYELPMA